MERSLEPSVPTVGKESPREQPATLVLWVILWEPLLWSYPMEIAVESMRLNHWESDCDGEGGKGFQQPANGSRQTEVILGVLK